jgi:hypothetical protein
VSSIDLYRKTLCLNYTRIKLEQNPTSPEIPYVEFFRKKKEYNFSFSSVGD